MSNGVCWSQFGAVCWQPTGLMGVLGPVCGCMLATYRSYGMCLSQFVAGNLQVLWGVGSQFGAVCWQPTCLMGCVGVSLGLATKRSYVVCGASLGLYVGNLGNLHVLWGVLEPVWGCMLATYKSYGVCWSQFGAVCWQPIGLMGCV